MGGLCLGGPSQRINAAVIAKAIDAVSKHDVVPPLLANAGRSSYPYERFQDRRGKSLLLFREDYWQHADSQLRERLKTEARILRR